MSNLLNKMIQILRQAQGHPSLSPTAMYNAGKAKGMIHGDGGPYVGEGTRLHEVTCLSIYSLISI